MGLQADNRTQIEATEYNRDYTGPGGVPRLGGRRRTTVRGVTAVGAGIRVRRDHTVTDFS